MVNKTNFWSWLSPALQVPSFGWATPAGGQTSNNPVDPAIAAQGNDDNDARKGEEAPMGDKPNGVPFEGGTLETDSKVAAEPWTLAFTVAGKTQTKSRQPAYHVVGGGLIVLQTRKGSGMVKFPVRYFRGEELETRETWLGMVYLPDDAVREVLAHLELHEGGTDALQFQITGNPIVLRKTKRGEVVPDYQGQQGAIRELTLDGAFGVQVVVGRTDAAYVPLVNSDLVIDTAQAFQPKRKGVAPITGEGSMSALRALHAKLVTDTQAKTPTGDEADLFVMEPEAPGEE